MRSGLGQTSILIHVHGNWRLILHCRRYYLINCWTCSFDEVLAFVGDQKDSLIGGPVFRLPISVHKPEPLMTGLMVLPMENIPFAPGKTFRRFYEAP